MTTLTLEYIKHATGEFDAETVFQAILSNKSIQLIDAVSQCCNLRWLDLSRNQIIRMENLEGLAQLVSLDLSFNKIAKVQSLESLPKLERLNLKSNPISRVQDVQGLSSARGLRHVQFQNVDGTDFCPVCLQPEYRQTVLSLCPAELVALDSRRKHLPDLDAEVHRWERPPKLDFPDPEPWFTPADLDFGDTQDPDVVAAAMEPQVQDFTAAFADCKDALREAEELLNAAQAYSQSPTTASGT